MGLDRAISILKAWVKTDRKMRGNSLESDYDKFCETRNEAIETVLRELERVN